MAFTETKKWSDWLFAAEWWFSSSYRSSIKMSPFEVIYEYPPPHLEAVAIPSDLSPKAH
jgi:hypothetical protein